MKIPTRRVGKSMLAKKKASRRLCDRTLMFLTMRYRMAQAIFKLHKLNTKATFEIFIHKVDGMSDTYRLGRQNCLLHNQLPHSSIQCGARYSARSAEPNKRRAE